jgi:hypothetical protein
MTKEKTPRACWLKEKFEARITFAKKAYYKWLLTFNVLAWY